MGLLRKNPLFGEFSALGNRIYLSGSEDEKCFDPAHEKHGGMRAKRLDLEASLILSLGCLAGSLSIISLVVLMIRAI